MDLPPAANSAAISPCNVPAAPSSKVQIWCSAVDKDYTHVTAPVSIHIHPSDTVVNLRAAVIKAFTENFRFELEPEFLLFGRWPGDLNTLRDTPALANDPALWDDGKAETVGELNVQQHDVLLVQSTNWGKVPLCDHVNAS